MSTLNTSWGEKKDVRGLDTVRVKKASLLAKLKTNRESHLKEYEEAVKQYRELEVLSLTKVLKDLRTSITQRITLLENNELPDPNEVAPFAPVHQYRGNPLPISHIKDYDVAIAKLDMSVDEYLELDENEFSSFVMDDWQWKQMFKSATTALSSTYMANSTLVANAPIRAKKKK